MDTTARAARAHIIWISITLLLVLIASCLTYLFMPKVSGPNRISILDDDETESMFRKFSREKWLLKAHNHTDGSLLWEDEWKNHRIHGESILYLNETRIVIREKGVYLVYIQANFILKPQMNNNSTVDLKLLVELNYGDDKEIFSASHDTRVVHVNQSPDAKLTTFLLMYMQSSNQFSVSVYPSDMVNYDPRPFSTFLTIIKCADNW